MTRPFFVSLFLLASSYAFADYTQMQWGLDKSVSPYAFGANINGTWRSLGTVSSTGTWVIPVSKIYNGSTPLLSAVNTWTATQNVTGDYLTNDGSIAPGQYRSPIVATAGVAASVSDNITAGLFTLQNLRNYDALNPYAGLNSAIYVQGIKYGTGATWGATIEGRDHTGTGDPSQALQALEVDMVANGTDVNKVRSAVPIVLFRYNRPPASGSADVVVGSAISLATYVTDQTHAKFTDGFIIQAGTTVDTAINLSNATINTNAITSPGFSLGPTGNLSAATGTFSSTLGVTGATTLSSTLGVTGAATLNSTLGVTGLATFSGGWKIANTAVSSTAPTIGSGFGTSPSIVASNGTAAFQVNVGTGGTASSGVITLPAAANGWSCSANDITTVSTSVFLTRQTASTTTSVTITNYNTAGAATAWVASDKINMQCMAF